MCKVFWPVNIGWFLDKWHDTASWHCCITADQVYGDQEMHAVIRKSCVDYMVGIIMFSNRSNITRL